MARPYVRHERHRYSYPYPQTASSSMGTGSLDNSADAEWLPSAPPALPNPPYAASPVSSPSHGRSRPSSETDVEAITPSASSAFETARTRSLPPSRHGRRFSFAPSVIVEHNSAQGHDDDPGQSPLENARVSVSFGRSSSEISIVIPQHSSRDLPSQLRIAHPNENQDRVQGQERHQHQHQHRNQHQNQHQHRQHQQQQRQERIYQSAGPVHQSQVIQVIQQSGSRQANEAHAPPRIDTHSAHPRRVYQGQAETARNHHNPRSPERPHSSRSPTSPQTSPVIPSGYPLHRPPTHPLVSQYQYAHLPQQPQQMYQPAPYDPTAYERARTNLPSHRPSPRAASRSRPRSQPRSPASSHYPSPPQRYFSISSAESPPQRRVHTNTSHHDPSSPETYEQPLDRQTTAYRSMSNETTETCAPINPIIPTPSPGPSTPQVQRPLQSEASKGWSHGLCDPSGDCGTCCLGLFCPCVLFGRVQHRLRLKRMHQDSTNLVGHSGCNAPCTGFMVLCGCQFVMSALQSYKVREMYGIDGNCAKDCAKGTCCLCCTFVQNEKEIREREKGHSRLVTTQPQAIGPMSYPGGLG